MRGRGAADRVVEELDAGAGGGEAARVGGGDVRRVGEVVDGEDVHGGRVRGRGVDVDAVGDEGAGEVGEGEARGGECLGGVSGGLGQGGSRGIGAEFTFGSITTMVPCPRAVGSSKTVILWSSEIAVTMNI